MNNKSIWITGASSGIGKALALKFAKEHDWKLITEQLLTHIDNLD